MHESVCGNFASYFCNLLDYESFLPLIPCSGIIKSDAQNHTIIIIPQKFTILKTIINDNEFERGEDSLTEVNY